MPDFPTLPSIPTPFPSGCPHRNLAREHGDTLYSRQCRVTAGPNITNVSPPSNRKRSIDRSIVFCRLYVCSTYTHSIQLLLPYYNIHDFRQSLFPGLYYILRHTSGPDFIESTSHNRNRPRTIIAKAITFRVDGRHHGAAVSRPIY